MPSSIIGALRVTLGLDSAQFESGASRAEKRAEQLGFRIGKSLRTSAEAAISLRGALTALGGVLAAKELLGATQRALDYTDAIADLSDRTGASTKVIQEFRYAAQLSGSSIAAADQALDKFAKTQGLAQRGSDQQVKLFRELGVTSTNFDTALRQAMDGLAKLPTIQQRNAAALQLFGKSAGSLTQLLGQGSAGFDLLAQRAQQLGVVLRDDVIRNAGQANDQLDTMKMILNAQFANVVAQNANSISALAQAIGDLTGKVIQFLSSNPQAAVGIMGALAGGRVGGLPGAAAGGLVGAAAGGRLQQVLADNSMDVPTRQREYAKALREYAARIRTDARVKAGTQPLIAFRNGNIGNSGATLASARAEVDRQKSLLDAAQKAAAAPKPQLPGVVPTVGNAEAASAARKALQSQKQREREAEQAAQRERQYQAELSRSEVGYLQARQDLTVDQVERAALERETSWKEHQQRLQSIDTDKDLSQAQKARLTAIENDTQALRDDLINRRENEELARQELELARSRNDNEQDVLHAHLELARTAKERRDLELKLLDIQFRQLNAEQDRILASHESTEAEKQIAAERKETLAQLQGLASASIERQNQGPLAQYLDSIPRTADEINEALESVQVDGLRGLSDGLADAIAGTRSLGDVFKNVSQQIIADLVKIAAQKLIVGALGNALGGLFGGGGSGGLGALLGGDAPSSLGGGFDLSKLIKFDPIMSFGGARANGGPVMAGKTYLVGERGPELFSPSAAGQIISNDNLGRSPIELKVYADEGATFVPRVEAISSDVSVSHIQKASKMQGNIGRRRLGR